MSPSAHQSWLYRYACATPCVAMVTVVAGALVTINHAGMAFRDWPTSDGQAMLTYPWWSDFATNWDRFLEHGHRLAGMLIGVWTIGLAVLLAVKERRTWLKWAGGAILLAVICQGILGGFRVWLDDRGLAMVHGMFAACVISLMASVATALSSGWRDAEALAGGRDVGVAKPVALLTVALLAAQYVLGGMIRHHGLGLFEHLTVGIVSLVLIVINAVVAHCTRVAWLQSSGRWLLAAALIQVALGGGAWVTRFGFASLGYVAVADSITQIVFRTAHTAVGMVLLANAVVHAVRVLRIAAFAPPEAPVVLNLTPVPGRPA
ncbi:MAG: COX15/CtaA family protein [Planctomycetaceae bacterium]|nr:COX15/CtaA family protein [Planctomycetaceae bacterium]